MLRAVLLGLLAVSATSSCGGGGDAAQVAPGAVAGKVLEASGRVTATRDGSPRPLAAGAEVFADDVIDTANGSVLILLHHNNARWAVESGQRTRVDQSLAWKLARQDGPAQVVDHASSAAGREGERTAADTRATTEAAPAPQAAVGATAPPQEPPRAAVTGGPGEAAAGAGSASASASTDAESRADRGGGGGGGGAGGGGAGGGKAAEPKSSKRVPAANADKKIETDADARADLAPEAAPETAVAPPEVRLRGQLEARRAELQRCAGKLALTLVVRVERGAPAIELTGGAATPAVRACLERVVTQLPLAGLTARASIDLGKPR